MTASVEGWALSDMPPAETVHTRYPTRYDSREVRSAPYRLRDDQSPFLHEQFSQAAQDDTPVKYKSGQHADELSVITKELKAEFDEIGDLNPEFLRPFYYRDSYANEGDLPILQQRLLHTFRLRRRARLFDAGKQWNSLSQEVQLPPGLLDVPPYRRQGDTGAAGEMGCLSTCFRMVYQAASGIVLSELAVNDALGPLVGHRLPDDNLYLKALRSKAFRDKSSSKVTPITIGGADLSDIAQLTSRLKAAKSDIGVYAVAMLTSEIKDDVWHANVLLAADRDNVVVHDPSNREGGQKYRRLSRLAFHGRWAGALNKTHLIVVDKQPRC